MGLTSVPGCRGSSGVARRPVVEVGEMAVSGGGEGAAGAGGWGSPVCGGGGGASQTNGLMYGDRRGWQWAGSRELISARKTRAMIDAGGRDK